MRTSGLLEGAWCPCGQDEDDTTYMCLNVRSKNAHTRHWQPHQTGNFKNLGKGSTLICRPIIFPADGDAQLVPIVLSTTSELLSSKLTNFPGQAGLAIQKWLKDCCSSFETPTKPAASSPHLSCYTALPCLASAPPRAEEATRFGGTQLRLVLFNSGPT